MNNPYWLVLLIIAMLSSQSAAAWRFCPDSPFYDKQPIYTTAISSLQKSLEIEVRCAPPSRNYTKRSRFKWMIVIDGDSTLSSYKYIAFSYGGDQSVDDFRPTTATIETGKYANGTVTTEYRSVIDKGFHYFGAPNSVNATWRNEMLTLSIGHKTLDEKLTIPWPEIPSGLCGFMSEIPCLISDIKIESKPWPDQKCQTGVTEDDLARIIDNPITPIEGYWQFLDRETDSQYAHLGGEYTLALIRNPNGGYDILYIDGAITETPNWHKGMKKGILVPTRFLNHYNLTWYDSHFEPISQECYADITTDNTILDLHIPLLKSRLRFVRMTITK